MTWQGRVEWILVPIGVVVYFMLPHEIGVGDAALRFHTLDALMSGQLLDMRYSIVQPLLATPLWAIGQFRGSPYSAVVLFNTTIFVSGLGALVWLLWSQIPHTLLRRTLLLLLATSMFSHHIRIFYGEVLTAVAVAIGLLCLISGRSVLGYLLLMVGVVNTPATVPALFLALLANPRQHRLWHAVWPTALATGLIMFEFYIRRGSPFLSGYEGDRGPITALPLSGQPGFSYPLVFGVLSILFSFGKGLMLFVPGLWLVLKRPIRPVPDVLRLLQRMSIAFLVGLVVVYSKWWAWHGAGVWGPRFFLFACVPASIALAVHLSDHDGSLRSKALTLGLLAWSVWVAITGVAIGLDGLELCYEVATRWSLYAGIPSS